MAVQFDGGVVLGADSRTTTGSYIANRVTDKLTPVQDLIYCCRSGSAADTQAIADIVRYHLQLVTYGPAGACPDAIECKKARRPTSKRLRPSSSKCATATRTPSKPASLSPDGTSTTAAPSTTFPSAGRSTSSPLPLAVHRTRLARINHAGSGSTYIYGYCDATYRDGMTRDECEKFVVNSLALAMSRDGSSGGVIRLAIIDRNGVERKVLLQDEQPQFWQG